MKAVVPAAPTPILNPSRVTPCEQDAPRAFAPVRSASPSLSVVVVNYRSWDDTARLVQQLRTSAVRDGAAEIMIVDNHSPPHPQASRLRRTEGVSLRRWGRNRGFARAVNEGVRLSLGRWVLLLNPDVTVGDEFLDDVLALTIRLDRDEPRVGIVGLGVRNADGSRQPTTGPFPTLLGTLARLLLPRARRKCHLRSPNTSQEVPWATGCCLLVRRRLLDELGGFDPDFFLYYEDVDLPSRPAARLVGAVRAGVAGRPSSPLARACRDALSAAADTARSADVCPQALVTVAGRTAGAVDPGRGVVEGQASVAPWRHVGGTDVRAAAPPCHREADRRFHHCTAASRTSRAAVGDGPARRTTSTRRQGTRNTVSRARRVRSMIPCLSIVIPSHNRPDLLRACLDSVLRHMPPDTEIVVVDDASPGGVVGAAARAFAGVRVERLERRSGFCVAANAGLGAWGGAVGRNLSRCSTAIRWSVPVGPARRWRRSRTRTSGQLRRSCCAGREDCRERRRSIAPATATISAASRASTATARSCVPTTCV